MTSYVVCWFKSKPFYAASEYIFDFDFIISFIKAKSMVWQGFAKLTLSVYQVAHINL